MQVSGHLSFTGNSQVAELYQVEKLNQLLFNNFPDPTCIVDLEGNFLMVNEKSCLLTGLSREQLLGKSFVSLVEPAYLAATQERFQLVKEDKPQQFETAIVTPEGTRYVDITNFPLKVGNQIEAVFAIAKDITGQKQKELDLQQYANLLKTQNEELEVFRKIIAHDMRKPVNNAIGFAQILESGMLPAEEQNAVIGNLLRTVQAVDGMVRDLNEVIALKSVGRESKEQVAVAASVQTLLASFDQEIKNIHAAVNLAIAPDLTVFTVKAYFTGILRNLISNALKYYSRDKAPVLQIRAAVKDGKQVEITVEDNGIGMDLAQVSGELFKMHRRFAPAMADGHGLGLYIVQQQVQLLGGSIMVDSAPGAGTVFTFSLPLDIIQ